MTEERKTYLQEMEAHGADNGWVAPLTEEDREFCLLPFCLQKVQYFAVQGDKIGV